MATHKKQYNPIYVMGEMAANDKVSTKKLEDAFADLDSEQVREWADALEQFCTALETAREAFESWQYAEGREEKSDARDELLGALEEVDNSSMIFNDLPDIECLGLFNTAPPDTDDEE